ncbi:MAG: AAA family ATPase [Gemmatimonadetes bacterium]|nr:AAA family ATPase [Gemmatimonadota bacterium]
MPGPMSLSNRQLGSPMLLQPVVCPILVGRAIEMHALLGLLDRAARGSGDTVLVAGDAGIGKSRLCRELRREAVARQLRVIEGRCSAAESSVAYAPFMDALRFRLAKGEGETAARILGPLISQLAPLFPELPTLQADLARERATGEHTFEAIYHVFRRLAGLGPLLVVLEDIHWADPTSCDLIHHLCRRITSDPVLLIVTHRPEDLPAGHPARHLVGALVRERLARELVLPPLSESEVGQFVTAIVDSPPDAEFVRAVWQRSEGNPFFIEELLKALSDTRGLGEPPLRAADLHRTGVPVSISEAVKSRVEPLGLKALEVLSVAAVIGRRFNFDLLAAVSEMREDQLLPVIEQLMARQILVEEEGAGAERLAFRHAITQEVFYNDIIARRRRMWHRRVATALEAGPAEESAGHFDTLAYHCRLGGDGVRARRYDLLAGDQAARLAAWGDAAAHYERALEVLEGMAPDRATEALVLERLAEVTWWQGRVDDSKHYAEEALALRRALGDRLAAAVLLRRLGTIYSNLRGQAAQAPVAYQEAFALLADEPPSAEHARIATDLGRVYLTDGDFPEAERWLERGLALARPRGDRAEEALALAELGHLAIRRAQIEAGAARLEKARSLAAVGSVALDRAFGVFQAGIRAFEAARDHRRALEWITAALRHADRHGVVGDAAICQAYRAAVDRRLGRLDRAAVDASAAVDRLRAAKRAELRESLRILGDIHRMRGEGDAARRCYDEAVELGERDAEVGRALVLLAEGRAGEAAQALSHALESRSADHRLFALRVLPFLVEASVRAGALAEARSALARLAKAAARTDFRSAGAALAHAWGLVHAAEGDTEGARAVLAEAAESWASLEQPFERARAETELAALLVASGDRDRGTEYGRAALAEFNRFGAALEAERARQTLRRAGVRVPRRTPGHDAESAAHGLTLRERDVLAQVVSGATNRQIARALGISEKTAGVHVGHILEKLGCATRTQAASYAITERLVAVRLRQITPDRTG